MGLRDIRQQELADRWIDYGKFGIINAAPRFGKIKVAIKIMEKIKPKTVLIAYPDNKIRDSWLEDFDKFGFSSPSIRFTTFLSLHKYAQERFDLVILDECHLLSDAQMEVCKTLIASQARRCVLGLTGTLSRWTAKGLSEELSLPVVAKYSIEMAIKEGILPDYEINVVRVSLDDRIMNDYNGKRTTEKKKFANYKWVVDKLEREEKPSFHMKLKMIGILQSSIAKRDATIRLIEKFKDERLLVFCGRTEIADSLGIPSYHSKSSEKDVWDDFVGGISKHLAVVKIGNSGVTYLPLNKVIINHFDSNPETMTQRVNRCMSMEYDNPEKKASIWIVCSTEKKEIDWLANSLSMFDKNKIKYI